MSKVESDDEDSWIVGVDLKKKELEFIKPYCSSSASSFHPTVLPSSFDPTVLPCAFSEYMNATPRPYAELVAASFSQNRVLNNHVQLGDTIPVASSAQNGVLNNHLPLGDTIPIASSAQNGVSNGHLPLGDTVPDNVQHQQNTLNVDGYYGSWNGSRYGAHSGDGNYQQPTPLQPQYVLTPNLPPTVQPMSSSTQIRVYLCPLVGSRRPWKDVDDSAIE